MVLPCNKAKIKKFCLEFLAFDEFLSGQQVRSFYFYCPHYSDLPPNVFSRVVWRGYRVMVLSIKFFDGTVFWLSK